MADALIDEGQAPLAITTSSALANFGLEAGPTTGVDASSPREVWRVGGGTRAPQPNAPTKLST